MSRRSRSLSPSLLLALCGWIALSGCDDPDAGIEITETRTTRDPARHVIFEIDVLAHESLGKNVGTYCTEVTFVGQAAPTDRCDSDLHDGDRKTLRFVSENVPAPGSGCSVRIRLGAVDTLGGDAAPP
jgi:hypothetical protein